MALVRNNMTARAKLLLKAAFGVGLIGGMSYGTWLLVRAFMAAMASAAPEVTAAIVGAMATVLVGVSAVLISQAHERKRVSEEAHRLKKVEIYQAFIDMISRMIGSSNEHLSVKAPDDRELINYLFKFKADILLWGSPKVIRAQINFEEISGSGDTTRLFKCVNELYIAIREDIGLSNSGLQNLELVKLYLNSNARASLRRDAI